MLSPEDLANLGKNVIANSAPFVPIIKEGFSSFKSWWNGYNEYNQGQIRALQKYYIAHCYPLESKHTLTTLNISRHEAESEQEKKLPIYLLMEGVFPVLYQRKFKPKILMDDWIIYVGKGLLRPAIEEMISYLCQYQVERNSQFFQFTDRDVPFEYDPTNLLFEEFKAWLIYLSQARIEYDNAFNLREMISGRISYLGSIIMHQVFDPTKEKPPTRSDILQRIYDQLSKYVLPLIENEVSRQTAREHFGQLRVHIQGALHSGMKFLFYVLRDSKHTPQNFILSQIRAATMPFYKEVNADTSTQLLSCLLNTPMFKFIFPIVDGADQFHTLYEIDTLLVNPFSDQAGEEIYPIALISNTSKANNWYVSSSGKNTGIYSYFCTLGCSLRLMLGGVGSFANEIQLGKEIIIVKNNSDFIIYYKNKFSDQIENFSCNEDLKKLFLPLAFTGKTLINNQNFEELYKRVYEEVDAKGGYIRAPIKSFIRMHSLLHKLSNFYLVCDLLYDIAGDGGNLLVYGKAMNLVKGVIEELNTLLHNISLNSQFLYQEASVLRKELDSKPIKKASPASFWRQNYVLTDAGYKHLRENIKSSQDLLEKITLAMQKVAQKSYLNAVYQKLELLERVANVLGGKKEKIKVEQEPKLLETKRVNEDKQLALQFKEGEPGLLETKDVNENKRSAVLKLYHQENYQEAFLKLLEIHQECPDDDEINYALADILHTAGQEKDALVYLDACIKNNATGDWGQIARFLKATILSEQKDYEAAESEINTLLELLDEGSEDYEAAISLQKKILKAVGKVNMRFAVS